MPEGFFSVLASPVKSVYGHILLLIYDMSRHHGFGIRREHLVEEIQEYLELLETGRLSGKSSEPPEGHEEGGQSEIASTVPGDVSRLTYLLDEDLLRDSDEAREDEFPLARQTCPGQGTEAIPGSGAPVQAQTGYELPRVSRSPRERASAIVRKFKRAGWLDIEVRSDYREIVIIPDYAMEILRALHKVASQERPSYRGYVYSTYAALVEAAEPRADAVNVAYEGTNELIGYLHSLYQNIKRYTQRILAQKRPQDILAVHFLEYQQEILDKAYHQLKTSDSVYKYRSKILQTVKKWKSDPTVISTLAQSALDEKLFAGSHVEAKNDILTKLSFIETSYANIDDILNEIDRKNEQYARASLQRVKYFLNESRDTEGALIRLLGLMGDRLERGLVSKREDFAVGESFSLADIRVLGSGSLYTPRRARRHTPAEISDYEPDETEMEAVSRRLAKRMFRRISYEEVDGWIAEKLGERDSVRAGEMDIEGMEDFVRLIYAAAYSQSRRVRYEIEPLDTVVEAGDGMFRFTDVLVRRRPGVTGAQLKGDPTCRTGITYTKA